MASRFHIFGETQEVGQGLKRTKHRWEVLPKAPLPEVEVVGAALVGAPLRSWGFPSHCPRNYRCAYGGGGLASRTSAAPEAVSLSEPGRPLWGSGSQKRGAAGSGEGECGAWKHWGVGNDELVSRVCPSLLPTRPKPGPHRPSPSVSETLGTFRTSGALEAASTPRRWLGC